MAKEKRRRHITFIGMPSAGKTKVGRILAELLGINFIDIDEQIVASQGAKNLQEIVDKLSPQQFAKLEEKVAIETVKGLSRPTVIATGGSMVYYDDAMRVFREHTRIIHLHASLATIERRVAKKPDRGIVFAPGETLADLYERRMPLYEKWAHQTVNVDGKRRFVAEALAEGLQREKFF
jgi:shikimate kinase